MIFLDITVLPEARNDAESIIRRSIVSNVRIPRPIFTLMRLREAGNTKGMRSGSRRM
ncbi:MAG: hypothetical protein QXW09_00725 [Thermoproteota archaeon]